MNNCDVCGEIKPTKKIWITYPSGVGIGYLWNICHSCEGLSPEEKDDIRARNFKGYWLWCTFHWAWWFLFWILVIGGLILTMAN
jgi:hypothetical protein